MKRLLAVITPSFAVVMLITFIVMSCGGGGGGGGDSGKPGAGPPHIFAEIFSLPTGSSLPGYKSAYVEVLEDETYYALPYATVTINNVTLPYIAGGYEGDVIVACGGSVVLNVSMFGKTYYASGTQLPSYPTINEPLSGSTWATDVPHTITWSGNYPMPITYLGIGIVDAADPNQEMLWPSGGYLLDLPVSATSYTIPAGAYKATGNGHAVVAVGIEIPISNAASDSSFLIGGLDYAPITITAP
jgi:hypothetical protein